MDGTKTVFEVRAALRALYRSQRFAVLSTDDHGQPFTSLMAFVLFGYDKLKAGGSSDRVPERHLIVVSAMGGVTDALLALSLSLIHI